MCTPQQSFQPSLARQPESQSWSFGYTRARNSDPELGHKAGYASSGEQLSLSDPWTNWGDSSNNSGGGGGDGSSNPTNPTTVSSDTWQPTPSLSPGQDSGSKFKKGVAVGVAAPWSSGPPTAQEEGGGASDLQQLMKNLDIAEHLHVLKVQPNVQLLVCMCGKVFVVDILLGLDSVFSLNYAVGKYVPCLLHVRGLNKSLHHT